MAEETIFEKLVNLVLRALTMIIRGVLIFGLAAYLPLADIGYFGVLSTSVTFFLLVIGIDFYVYSQRELVEAEPTLKAAVITNHFAAMTALYVLATPVVVALLALELIPRQISVIFLILAPAEHINQEIGRILAVTGAVRLTSWLVFIRSAAWAIPLFVAFHFEIVRVSLSTVCIFWITASIIALMIGSVFIFRQHRGWGRGALQRAWIVKGMKTSGLLFLSTVFATAIVSGHRIAIAKITTPEMLGKYTLATGIAGIIAIAVESTAVAFGYPHLLKLRSDPDPEAFEKRCSALRGEVYIGSLAMGVVTYCMFVLAQPYLGEKFDISANVLLPVLIGTIFYSLSNAPNCVLYALRKDQEIVKSSVTAWATFMVGVVIATVNSNFMIVIYSGVLSYALMWMMKEWYVKMS